MFAAEGQPTSVSGPVLIIVLLAGGTIYLFGYLRAVLHRANRDFKNTRAAVKPLRKAFWSAWFAALRTGLIVALGLALMVAWFVRDTQRADGDTTTPKPSPSASVRKTHR